MFNGTLHPYQVPAHDLITGRGRAMLAMEMGLGKTASSLSAIEHLMGTGEISEPGIVVVLASLKYQWAKAIKRFTDSTPLVIDGSPTQRQAQYETAMDWWNTGVDYVIVTYESVVNDYSLIEQLPRGFLILDECTAVKNFRTKRHEALKELAEGLEFVVGLTGTPMTNGNPEEIHAQFAVIDPSLLGGFYAFDNRYIVRNHFGGIENYRDLDHLHNRLKKAMYSKKQTDPDVAPFLPQTIYKEPVLVPLDRAGKALYRRIAADVESQIVDLLAAQDEWEINRLRGGIGAKVTAMRMLCDHPELLRISAREYDAATGKGSEYLSGLAADGHLDRLGKSPKLAAMAAYVGDFLESNPDNKVVIFSVFVPTLELIQQALGKYGSVTYSGQMNAKQKEAARTQFQEDLSTRVFISSDAGGYGVDLPQANLLVNYDLPWSSGTARQRNGRIQRVGSGWDHVVIQNFLVEGSLEERQWDMLQQKTRVETAVVDGTGIDAGGGVLMDVSSLRAFLECSGI